MAKEFNIDNFADKIYEATVELIESTVSACRKNPEVAFALIGTTTQVYLETVADAFINDDMKKHTIGSKAAALEIAEQLVKQIKKRSADDE